MKAYRRIQRSGIDFLLAATASAITAFSLGVSLAYAPLGLVFAGIIVVGTVFSIAISRRFSGQWADRVGIALYVGSAFASPFIAQNANGLLPAEGFPRELIFSAAPLTWMLAIGSFFAWRDQTLLFQCVPCIALFGLVGAFNTFDGATVTFFVFLTSAAVLYARSHQRTMLDRAQQSGYPKIEAIHGGPWRYMAGPEWGLISAAVVIILSAVGAPIIQLSVRQVSGVVGMRAPRIQQAAPTNMPSAFSASETRRVGQGPIGRLSNRELFRIKTPEPRYLRIMPFGIYEGGTWTRTSVTGSRSSPQDGQPPFPFLSDENLQENFDATTFYFRFSGGAMAKLPIPTPFVGMSRPAAFTTNGDGSINVNRVFEPDRVLTGTFYMLKPGKVPVNGPPDSAFTGLYKEATTTLRVVELARSTVIGAETDFEKAKRIKRTIETRVRYNLNAGAAPEREDPVDWFLFGPEREGYCDLFASAMVLMARAADIPARYVVGYYPVNGEVDQDGFHILRESEAHAWAELYFDGVGWIPFDATEGAVQVPGGEVGSARDSQPFYESEAFWILSSAGFAALVAGALYWRHSIRMNGLSFEQQATTRLLEAYEQHVGSLELVSGATKWASESPDEYFERVSNRLGNLTGAARANTERFASAFYGPRFVSAERLAEVEGATLMLYKDSAAFAKSRRKGIIRT